jgi:hypothetical protein
VVEAFAGADDKTRTLKKQLKEKMTMKKFVLSLIAVTTLAATVQGQVAISNLGYTQDFNSIGSGLPTGWDVRTGATASALGNTASFTTNATSWGETSGAFKNYAASTGLTETATSSDQSGSTNRALGIRQTGAFGDPGASFNFHFSTLGVQVTSISLDLMMLSVQTRLTTWSIQYGVGANPTSFTTLGTWSDPGAFGATSFNFTTANFGTALDNQSDLWFRVAALSGSTGSGNRDSMGIDNFSIAAVPEPSTYALIALGLGGLILARRWQRSAKA